MRSQLCVAFELCAAMCAHNCDTRQSYRLVTIETLIQFLQLRIWIHDNLCYLTTKSDSGQHSQFLRCFCVSVFFMAIFVKSALKQILSYSEYTNDKVWMPETSQELRMLSTVTLDCQVTKIVMNSGSQL